ncbi:hypothetical protein CMI37_07800 [Candidatus Pacearchaeota archaeon]|nr:hypothetical protein [Candidatus Pacearchaeota archaeon]|tara:strand:- start:10271 stop:10663 length:393 start_codon:yes stop_codon:yes gene_type:complete
MVFTAIEWMALILVMFVAIKLIVILVNPNAWNTKVIKKVWAHAHLAMAVSLGLAAVVLYYLLQSGLTIVQILAVTLFVALLMGAGAAAYKNEIIELAENLLKDKSLVKKSWLYIVIWIILIVWGAKILLF